MGSKGIVHILGIGGTLMASIALLAKEYGYKVTGQDRKVNPPTLDMLKENHIEFYEGLSADHIDKNTDIVVVGNVMSRGMPVIEEVLDSGISYISGAQFLYEYILHNKKVIAVSGTHGKTSTSSMIAWILQSAGHDCGFLIGGVPNNWGYSSRLGSSEYFVIEADEYDTAFFDKRPKFLHYKPEYLLINNIEFDHADIYKDLDAILLQFHYLIRTLKPKAKVIYPNGNASIDKVISKGCWSKTVSFDYGNYPISLLGEHYQQNASGAFAVAKEIGIDERAILDALKSFTGVKRRQELIFFDEEHNIKVIDDFAHHPSAIEFNVRSFKEKSKRLIAILNFSSNTMELGVSARDVADSLECADLVYYTYSDSLEWPINDYWEQLGKDGGVFPLSEAKLLQQHIASKVEKDDTILIMSNRRLEVAQMLTSSLQAKAYC